MVSYYEDITLKILDIMVLRGLVLFRSNCFAGNSVEYVDLGGITEKDHNVSGSYGNSGSPSEPCGSDAHVGR